MGSKGKYCMIRSYSAGVFAGELVSKIPDGAGYFMVVLKNARRIYRWAGAASLSQLAVDGTSKPSECRFPCEVPSIELAGVIEIVPISPKAKASIANVPVWSE